MVYNTSARCQLCSSLHISDTLFHRLSFLVLVDHDLKTQIPDYENDATKESFTHYVTAKYHFSKTTFVFVFFAIMLSHPSCNGVVAWLSVVTRWSRST